MTTATATATERSPWYTARAEAALVALTVTAVIGFWRVFDRPSFLVPMLAVALVTHAGMILGRRRGWSVPATLAVTAPVVAAVCCWLVFGDTMFVGLPTPATGQEVVDSLVEAWHLFPAAMPPVVPAPGFVVASCTALFFGVFLADWAAFRLWSSFEAIVPAATLFGFCAYFVADYQLELVAGALFIAALLVFVLLHRLARQESSTGWLAGDRDAAGDNGTPPLATGRRGPVTIGIALVAVAMIAAVVIGPRLPGLSLTARWGRGSGLGGQGERKAVSPLVDIGDRLRERPDTPLFTVRASKPAYWRLTSLETFDGEIWKSAARYGAVDGELPGEAPEAQGALIEQTFTISNLDMIWAPAAYRAVRVSNPSVGLNFNEDSSTLIVESGSELAGARYTIHSREIQPTTEALRSVRRSDIPDEIKDRYLGLPNGFSNLARQTAETQTEGIDRPYDAARALQSFFRNEGPGGFRYDLEFDIGHGESAIDAFLTQRRGFCEQFAGTFAAMARSIGLPARVAVGFTQGAVRDPANPDRYEVTGRQTHAWPEVYLGRYGWVPFEPTPGRGMPDAPWTDVPPGQDVQGASVAPPLQPPGTATLPGAAPGPDEPAPPTTESPTTTIAPPASTGRTEEADRSLVVQALLAALPVLAGLIVLAGGMALLLALYIVGVARLQDRRRRERRARVSDARASVSVAWLESLEALRPLGLVPAWAESHDEFATRVAPRLGDAAADLRFLADAVDRADYAGDGVADDLAAAASRAATTITETAQLLATPRQQWLARLDPRPLADGRRREPHHTISSL